MIKNWVELLFLTRISFNKHLIISAIIRFVLIVYGEIHDENSELPFTDVDYKVVTDGARHIFENKSPFQRHTYRYSPLLAFLLLPNILVHKCFGKILFSLFDILVGILIQKIVVNEIKCIFFSAAQTLLSRKKTSQKDVEKFYIPERYQKWAKLAALLWLYNPLTMMISTRGNGDSLSSFFVLSTIYFLQKYNFKSSDCFLAGLCNGLAIHLRIYPIVFSLAMFLSISDRQLEKSYDLIKQIFFPNKKQILLTVGTVVSFFCLTFFFYKLYGWEYIYEAYLYHIFRKDTRHNFSLYFLMQYLSTDKNSNILLKILTISPQLIILLHLSLSFGTSRKTLSFCIFAQTFVMVTYNSVVTSQYFVWYLALLPLCIKNLRKITPKLALTYFCLWILGQALWLLPAYLMEFKSLNTFNFIGVQSVAFFFINVFILQRFIYNFDVFGRVKHVFNEQHK